MRKDDRNFRHLLPMDPPRRRIRASTWFRISAVLGFLTFALVIVALTL